VNVLRAASPLLAFVLLVPAAPAPQPPPAAPGLGGTSWRLVKFQGGDGTTLTPDDRSKYALQFAADGTLTARIDCNRGRGSWKSAATNQVQFGPLAITRAMCPPGSLHDRILKHWDFIRSYVIRNGHLFLSLAADGGIYEFEPLLSASLGETAWDIVAMNNGKQGVASTVNGTTVTLALQTGTVVGNTGCNNYRGTYKVEGSTIAFSGVAMTRRMCPGPGVMEQESQFLAALAASTTWAIEGDTLDLRGKDGARQIQARRVAAK
jgi:heat shock protein HslJ